MKGIYNKVIINAIRTEFEMLYHSWLKITDICITEMKLSF